MSIKREAERNAIANTPLNPRVGWAELYPFLLLFANTVLFFVKVSFRLLVSWDKFSGTVFSEAD
jgi:hypothetical protein